MRNRKKTVVRSALGILRHYFSKVVGYSAHCTIHHGKVAGNMYVVVFVEETIGTVQYSGIERF